jgi:hypothetical protein
MPKSHNVVVKTEIEPSVSLAGTGFKAGLSKTKGWFQKIFTASRVRQADGSDADVTQTMKRKRFGNWYSEKVVDSAAGVIKHECEEPLDVHQGHGSDKK